MSGRLHARLHSQFGFIHTSIESAFLTSGMVLSTLLVLVVVYVVLLFLGR